MRPPAASLPSSSISNSNPPAETSTAENPQKWWVLIAIGISTFMSALDGSVVNTILPVINRTFGSQVASVEWIVTVYLLVLSGLLLSFGRLGDLRGHKIVYLAGFAVFLVSSALCGFASSVGALVASRGVQALGAAMLSANSPAILTKSFPARQRGQALGMQATMTYLGLVTGPSLGGWLADQFSWRAVFYINIPVGLVAFLLSLRYVTADRPRQVTERFDLPGAGVFTAGLVTLLLGLNQGATLGWGSLPILGLLGAALLLLALFVVIENRSASPMLDLSLFRERVFSASVASAVLNYICVYSILFLMPFYLIQGRGLSTAQAGLVLTAQPAIMAIVAPISGTLSDRLGTSLLAGLGMSILVGGLLLLSRLGVDAPLYQVALSLGVAGLGTGIFISPNNSALMGAAPRQRQGIAAGIMATSRNVGMVLGVGLAGAIFTTLFSSQPGSDGLFQAIAASFLAAAGFALLGVPVSVLKRKH